VFDFKITRPKGAVRLRPASKSSQRQRGAAAAAAAAAAAVGQQGEQQQGFVTQFCVDASSCLDGNPLAHMLDYRALAADWPRGMFDDERSLNEPNAVLLPVSDNTTGKVYVAVVALRDIIVASGEDVSIDYELQYWRNRRSLEQMLQASWVLVGWGLSCPGYAQSATLKAAVRASTVVEHSCTTHAAGPNLTQICGLLCSLNYALLPMASHCMFDHITAVPVPPARLPGWRLRGGVLMRTRGS
jgi:hypothetical protein